MSKVRHRRKYRQSLRAFPRPGVGAGCHGHLLRVANYGRLSGFPADQVFSDIKESVPDGSRIVPDREIRSAVETAFEQQKSSMRTFRPRLPPDIARARFFAQSAHDRIDLTEAELIDSSPILPSEVEIDNLHLLLDLLYKPGEHLFIGERHQKAILGDTLRSREEWLEDVHARLCVSDRPHFLPNPILPPFDPSGVGSRGDHAVSVRRFAVVEFDGISQEEQLRLWWNLDLPVAALVHSGNESIHGWIRVDAADPLDWERKVKNDLYRNLVLPLGADPVCAHPSRLSRTPGAARKGRFSRLLWLNPEGGRVRG